MSHKYFSEFAANATEALIRNIEKESGKIPALIRGSALRLVRDFAPGLAAVLQCVIRMAFSAGRSSAASTVEEYLSAARVPTPEEIE